MDFPNLTYRGLTKALNYELWQEVRNGGIPNYDKITRLQAEIQRRSLIKDPQMSYSEQIYWILEEINFEKILKVMKYLEIPNWAAQWDAHTGQLIKPDIDKLTVDDLRKQAKGHLDRVSRIDECEIYNHATASGGGWVAERFIYDGVGTLKLTFKLTGWDMDYDSVTSDNYDGENKYTGPVDD